MKRKNKKSVGFIKEFSQFSQIPHIVDETDNNSDFKEFRGHRWDQSVLSNLAIKYNIKKFRSPAQGGNNLKKPEFRKKGEWLKYPYTYSDTPDESSDYPTIFYNRRSATLFRLFLISLHSKLPLKLKLIVRTFLK